VIWHWRLTLTYHHNWLSISASDSELWSWPMHTKKLKFKGQSVQKTECKQTNLQTDTTDCFTFPEFQFIPTIRTHVVTFYGQACMRNNSVWILESRLVHFKDSKIGLSLGPGPKNVTKNMSKGEVWGFFLKLQVKNSKTLALFVFWQAKRSLTCELLMWLQ